MINVLLTYSDGYTRIVKCENFDPDEIMREYFFYDSYEEARLMIIEDLGVVN